MPRDCWNHVTKTARASLFKCAAKPSTARVPLGVQLVPERRLVAGSSQLVPVTPAPGEVRNGPVSCAAACGPVHVSVIQWSGSFRLTWIWLM